VRRGVPAELRRKLDDARAPLRRTISSEIIARLEASFQEGGAKPDLERRIAELEEMVGVPDFGISNRLDELDKAIAELRENVTALRKKK
jgi:polyhydroxyalkanoate synthesis regulator phasin